MNKMMTRVLADVAKWEAWRTNLRNGHGKLEDWDASDAEAVDLLRRLVHAVELEAELAREDDSRR